MGSTEGGSVIALDREIFSVTGLVDGSGEEQIGALGLQAVIASEEIGIISDIADAKLDITVDGFRDQRFGNDRACAFGVYLVFLGKGFRCDLGRVLLCKNTTACQS